MPSYLRSALAITLGALLITGCENIASLVPPSTGSEPAVNAGPPAWAMLKAGKINCDANKSFNITQVNVGKNMNIQWQGQHYNLNYIATASGAYRYENKTVGMVVIQTPKEIQLFNSKAGQRLANKCRQ